MPDAVDYFRIQNLLHLCSRPSITAPSTRSANSSVTPTSISRVKMRRP